MRPDKHPRTKLKDSVIRKLKRDEPREHHGTQMCVTTQFEVYLPAFDKSRQQANI